MGLIIGGLVIIIISAIGGWSVFALLCGIAAMALWVVGYIIVDRRDNQRNLNDKELDDHLEWARRPQPRKGAFVRGLVGLPKTRKSPVQQLFDGH